MPFFDLHWSSLLMLISAILGFLAFIAMIKKEHKISQSLGIPETVVTVSQKEIKRRHSRATMAALFVILFVSTLALFIVECFSEQWGVLFTIIRLVVMGTQFVISAFLIYFCLNNNKKR